MKTEQNVWTQKTGWQPSAPGTLGKSAQLVLVFGATDLLKQSPLLKELAGVYPDACFVGCSTGGEFADNGTRRFSENRGGTFRRNHVRLMKYGCSFVRTAFLPRTPHRLVIRQT